MTAEKAGYFHLEVAGLNVQTSLPVTGVLKLVLYQKLEGRFIWLHFEGNERCEWTVKKKLEGKEEILAAQ